jgi:hypothetical protein
MDPRDEHLSAYLQSRRLPHAFNGTFGANSAFNAEVFVAAPHAVAMEFDLFGGEAE